MRQQIRSKHFLLSTGGKIYTRFVVLPTLLRWGRRIIPTTSYKKIENQVIKTGRHVLVSSDSRSFTANLAYSIQKADFAALGIVFLFVASQFSVGFVL